ncbi:hypothetical protein ACQUSR_28220 [Streptomyces sp. P1-3]|uniref:hypothetical protein n=1 Tax=Streptomyces sp. P1-3 TaxID=3421658 RepID=UPI003D35A0E5
MRSSADRGRVCRRCGCRDHQRSQLGTRCPRLATDRTHGTWTFAVDLPSPSAKRTTIRRGGLTDRFPGRIHLNGPVDGCLPNTLNISIDGIQGHELLEAVPQIAASTGSACHSGEHQPSPVLSVMGLPDSRSLAALRLSLGRWATADDIDRTVEPLTAACLGGNA